MVKLQITTNSGEVDIVEVEEYNADETGEKINNNEVLALVFGGNIYSRIDIKSVKPIEDEPTENAK